MALPHLSFCPKKRHKHKDAHWTRVLPDPTRERRALRHPTHMPSPTTLSAASLAFPSVLKMVTLRSTKEKLLQTCFIRFKLLAQRPLWINEKKEKPKKGQNDYPESPCYYYRLACIMEALNLILKSAQHIEFIYF